MGPAVKDEETLRGLIRGGMDVARFNFSHGTHEEQKGRMDLLKKIRAEEKVPVAILLDTKGPEIRTGTLKDGKKIILKEGQTFVLTSEEIEGDEKKVSITYDGLADDVQAGSRILIDDGLIELQVKNKSGNEIVCTVINGGELGERKGVNVPNVPVRLPAITEKDKEDIRFGVEQKIDFIAASFVRNAECILEIKAYLKELHAPYIPIIAKIENAEGIQNIDEIIRCADGIMIARGDLGVEIPPENVPYLQKLIIQKCNDNYRPVITATQMLDSMIRNPRPTRAEVTDVANAVYDGTDAVMLSGETASGKYPLEALQMMVHIVENTEEHLDYDLIMRKAEEQRMKSTSSALCHATVTTAHNLGAKCIVAFTESGSTARAVSTYRPGAPIIAATPNDKTFHRLSMSWGVHPVMVPQRPTSGTELYDLSEQAAISAVDLRVGDIITITAGMPVGHVNYTNTLRVHQLTERSFAQFVQD